MFVSPHKQHLMVVTLATIVSMFVSGKHDSWQAFSFKKWFTVSCFPPRLPMKGLWRWRSKWYLAHLCLGIWSCPCQLSISPKLSNFCIELVWKHYGQRHAFFSLIRSIAKHQTLDNKQRCFQCEQCSAARISQSWPLKKRKRSNKTAIR